MSSRAQFSQVPALVSMPSGPWPVTPGDVVAVWQRSNGANTIIEGAVRLAGGTWQAPVELSRPGENAESPQVAIDSAGDVTAVWRRFSYRLALDFPTAELREKMWTSFSGTLDFTEREIALLVDLSEGFTGSDIREVYVRLRRRQLTKQQHPGLKDAFQVLQNMGIGEGEDRRFLSLLRSKDVQGIAASLRKRNAKLYSHAALADLLGVSKATAHRWVFSCTTICGNSVRPHSTGSGSAAVHRRPRSRQRTCSSRPGAARTPMTWASKPQESSLIATVTSA